MTPMRKMHLRLDPWKWEGAVLVGGTYDQFKRFVKRYIGEDVNVGSHSAGHAYVAYGQPWMLWIESRKNVGALAHEALHVTSGVLEARGMSLRNESEEAYTYTMEFIIRAVLTNKKWLRP